MTCIVGLVKKNKVYIGGDSAGVNSWWDLVIRGDEKVFQKENMVFGFTTSFRMGQILRYSFKIPYHQHGIETIDYMCSIFIDELIKCFKEKGYSKNEDNQVPVGDFLVGYNGQLFEIHNDFQVGVNVNKMAACGCGYAYALGALEILENTVNQYVLPEEKIKRALQVSAKFSAGVHGPFKIISI